MNAKDKVLFMVAIPTVAVMLWLFRQVLGSWTDVGLAFGGIAVAYIMIASCFVAVCALLYFATIYRAQRYAKQLRQAGYSVLLDKKTVREFAMATVVTLMIGSVTVWFALNQYSIYRCIEAGRCYDRGLDWYIYSISLPLVFGLVAVGALHRAVRIWSDSFYPLSQMWATVSTEVVAPKSDKLS